MQERLRVDRRLRGLNTPFAHNCFSNVTVCRLGVAMFSSACTMRYGRNCSNLSLGSGLVKKSLMFQRPAMCFAVNCRRLTRSRSQKNRTSMLLDRLALMVLFAKPSATVLSTRIGVGCCGYPNSMSVFLNCAPFCAFWKAAPSSASAADVTMHEMILLVQ